MDRATQRAVEALPDWLHAIAADDPTLALALYALIGMIGDRDYKMAIQLHDDIHRRLQLLLPPGPRPPRAPASAPRASSPH